MSWDIMGHQWAVDLLKSHIVNQRLRHAYLFTGPSGSGRRTLAIRYAQAINCLRPPTPGNPCGECTTCQQINSMEHPDLSILQAETSSGIIKVDHVRDIQRALNLSPYDARYRIGLVLNFENANPNAANALLKTLEEPPSKVILLLTAESAEALLPTIVSRCEILRLRPLPLRNIQRGLIEKFGIEDNQAKLLAHISGGRPGYAIRLNENPELLETRQQTLDSLDQLLHAPLVDRFAFAQEISSNREELVSALMSWSSLFRDVLLVSSGSTAPLTNIDVQDRIQTYAENFEPAKLHRLLNQIEDTIDMLDRYINARLATEILFLDLPNI